MAERRHAPDGARAELILLYGGQSPERQVSCVSALHVLRAAHAAGFPARIVGITSTGRWLEATEAARTVKGTDDALPDPDHLGGDDLTPGSPARGSSNRGFLNRGLLTPGDGGPMVVFPVLHGPRGEDGTVQGLLEMAGVAYVGAGVAGSAAAMDKGLAKALFAAAGLPQARYLTFRSPEIDDVTTKTVEAELGWPVFVKPANLGSTIGITRATNPVELAAAIDHALRFDEYLVIEEAIDAREIEVGVLGGPELRVSVPGEILPSHRFYDYEDKYLTGTATWQIPARLPAGVAEQIPELARATCRALRVDGMARVDLFLEAGTGRLLVNEVNTIPGFTPISMYPQMWAASGVTAPELIDELVAGAIARHRRRHGFSVTRS